MGITGQFNHLCRTHSSEQPLPQMPLQKTPRQIFEAWHFTPANQGVALQQPLHWTSRHPTNSRAQGPSPPSSRYRLAVHSTRGAVPFHVPKPIAVRHSIPPPSTFSPLSSSSFSSSGFSPLFQCHVFFVPLFFSFSRFFLPAFPAGFFSLVSRLLLDFG